MTLTAPLIHPDWPAPPHVHALSTTRQGGVSVPPYASFNLGSHVGDNPAAVAHNRALLRAHLPSEPAWLNQVHGTRVVEAATVGTVPPDADASVTRRSGSVVAAAHAGWRGLLGGVLEATVAKMACPPAEVLVWLGAAISPDAFEVGAEVRAAFVAEAAEADVAFQPLPDGKFLADIYQLARQRLARVGVLAVYGGESCTVIEREAFFSYRREGITGRMASLIWRD